MAPAETTMRLAVARIDPNRSQIHALGIRPAPPGLVRSAQVEHQLHIVGLDGKALLEHDYVQARGLLTLVHGFGGAADSLEACIPGGARNGAVSHTLHAVVSDAIAGICPAEGGEKQQQQRRRPDYSRHRADPARQAPVVR